ncbi:hypothetical protein TeGR_g15081 [Tetraparma gracilis]|uniref:Nicotinamidase n=1 Tax=Tetraparma gracilis TaxID=2962635 RepID=A0ABQ6M689_9STRA|nr:hypothetical protein TeGR_g15081 [Tetraparma gracilis]
MSDLLIIVDPQCDFHPGGSLAIPSAGADASRIGALLASPSCPFSSLVVTLDSHHKFDIAHPSSWKDAAGSPPAPFTLISNADVKAGKWSPADPSLTVEWALEYTAALEARGRFQLCIWPEHCLMGSPGHNVEAQVQAGISKWLEARKGGEVNWVMKGQNRSTEMYSAFKADVLVPSDPSTHLNTSLLASISSHRGKIYVCGQARSHCVNFTVRDLVANLGGRSAGDVVLLADCMSDVPGFEESGETFFKDMKELGVGIVNSTELL